MQRLLSFLRPHWQLVAALIGLNLLIAVLLVISPIVIKQVVDEVIAKQNLAGLPTYLGIIVAVAALRAAALLGYQVGRERLGQTVITDIRTALYRKLLALHWGYYDNERTGSLMSRMIGDVESTRIFLSGILIDSVNQVTTIVLLLAGFAQQDLTLALIAAVPTCIYGITLYLLFAERREIQLKIHQQSAVVNATLQDSLSGVKVVKAFAQEPQEFKKFDRDIKLLAELNIRSNRVWNLRNPWVSGMTRLMQLTLILVGGLRVMNGEISLGTLVAALAFANLMMVPVQQLGQQMTALGQTASAAMRIFQTLDEPIAIKSPAMPLAAGDELRGDIRFENVSFKYPKTNSYVLKHINLHVPAGTSLALVGATGAGKSTLANLIPRFYDPITGSLKIDNIDVREMDLSALRRHIAIVSQDPLLFSASIAENIAFGRVDATQATIERAAKLAQAHTFITALPKGYATVIGERGVGLSGGQKQRLAIARAILLDPRILILDDSMSAVDAETERLLQLAFAEVMRGRSTLLIAHRLSTVSQADQIMVLRNGQIVEQGSHNQLFAASGYYREILEMQRMSTESIT
ncbi:MAG: ABC transporter ATP-binding protein [Chloroflexota bacterium]